MGQPMYGYAQAGMPQQFLQQQQAMAGNRPAAVAAPGIPQQQQLQGMAGMQHHRLPHQQVQQQQQPVAAANQDDEWDLNAIPSDEDDDAGLPAQPATQVMPWLVDGVQIYLLVVSPYMTKTLYK